MAHEILNARPYAFLDNAPIEERRTHAVYTRRAGETSNDVGLGLLDATAIERVIAEAWPRATNPDELHEALLLASVLTEDEIGHIALEAPGWLETLAKDRRATHIEKPSFWVAAERLPLIQTLYSGVVFAPPVSAPRFERERKWEREEALREVVRGRIEISGPVTAGSLAQLLQVAGTEVEGALLALEAEGFVLRGKFHASAEALEWCDRRLLARIHRLTITRLRAEIQPVSIAVFLRFLMDWQRVEPGHRAEGPDGLLSVLEGLDGYGLAAAAWEPEVLALRMNEYDPKWLDQLCFTGQVGWGRLSMRQNENDSAGNHQPMLSPIRSSPVSVFLREHLPDWLTLAPAKATVSFSPDTAQVLQLFLDRGALFFGELLKQRSLLPSRVEQALAELAAEGWVTSDSFEGLRALLLPRDKRIPFTGSDRKRRHKSVSSVEFAGRWSLLRSPVSRLPGSELLERGMAAGVEEPRERMLAASNGAGRGAPRRSGGEQAQTPVPLRHGHPDREHAVETFARVLLRRYGVLFRRVVERESLDVSWLELSRACRRLEARGEIRGGYFVGGVGGEQFALPEAVGLLRSMRKAPGKGELLVINGADPLNFAGILTPGKRVAAIAANRVLLQDGVPIAALEAGEVLSLQPEAVELAGILERTLRIGNMAPALRPYYA